MSSDGHQQKGSWPSGSLDVVEEIKSRLRPERATLRPNTPAAVIAGIGVAAVAILLRLTIPTATGGEQAIFSFPAVVIATFLFGVRAGVISALICLAALWYYVIPPGHSFRLEGPSEYITALVFVFVASALIWGIAGMRHALFRYEQLANELEILVERRTAERNRVWDHSHELVAIVTPAGVIDAANPALRSKLALDLVPQTSFSSIIVDEDWPVIDAAFDKLAVGSPLVTFAARLRSNSGALCVEWEAAPDADCTYIVGREFSQ